MSEAGTLADSGIRAGASALPFPRERFWNLPNTITMLRIGVVPVLFFIPVMLSKGGSIVMAWCFIVAASSDLLDGYVARRAGEVTRIGKLLDPLADKLLITTALVMLMAAGRLEGLAEGIVVVVIIGRELAVTGLRGIASSHGQVVAASWKGKPVPPRDPGPAGPRNRRDTPGRGRGTHPVVGVRVLRRLLRTAGERPGRGRDERPRRRLNRGPGASVPGWTAGRRS